MALCCSVCVSLSSEWSERVGANPGPRVGGNGEDGLCVCEEDRKGQRRDEGRRGLERINQMREEKKQPKQKHSEIFKNDFEAVDVRLIYHYVKEIEERKYK